MNPLHELRELGQAVWLDGSRRALLESGALERLIAEDGICGLGIDLWTTAAVVAGSSDYGELLRCGAELDPPAAAVEVLMTEAEADAAALEQIYARTHGRDGHVTVPLWPEAMESTDAIVDAAGRMWSRVGRPNLMIEVPATSAGLRATEELIAAGINVNVTCLFAVEEIEAVAGAYMRGVERLNRAGGDPRGVSSVASILLNHLDAGIDGIIDERLQAEPPPETRARLQAVLGQTAIASARLAHARMRELFSGSAWESLAGRGARVQRLCLAGTSARDPRRHDVSYLEVLTGNSAVLRVGSATLDAFREHGRIEATLEHDLESAHDLMRLIEQVDISIQAVSERLLEQALARHARAFETLALAVAEARLEQSQPIAALERFSLPAELAAEVDRTTREWGRAEGTRRLWRRDATLWTGGEEAGFLGWLRATEERHAQLGPLRAARELAAHPGFYDAVLLGVDGPALTAELLHDAIGDRAESPDLKVLDTTDPGELADAEQRIDLTRTLFIVASKSGADLEPILLKDFLFGRVKALLGEEEARQRFVVVTDPGSALEALAQRERFRRVLYAPGDVNDRYSAVTSLGLLAGAVTGLELEQLLWSVDVMVQACFPVVPDRENPGVMLGLALAALARRGRDKLTLVIPPRIAALGPWIEQLIAGSTGKSGRGIIPVEGEPLGAPDAYGDDRLFVHLRIESEPVEAQEVLLARLERTGFPVLRLSVREPLQLGQELFRWQLAAVVAASVLGVNPFEEGERRQRAAAAQRLLSEYEGRGGLPRGRPLAHEEGLSFYTDARNQEALRAAIRIDADPFEVVRAHLERLQPGDYLALLAYVERNPFHDEELQAIRRRVRDARRVATTLGYGPRLQHTTAGLHSSGPDRGLFLQITSEDAVDLLAPGRKYSFGIVKSAQARADLASLTAAGRRVLSVHVDEHVTRRLARLRALIEAAL